MLAFIQCQDQDIEQSDANSSKKAEHSISALAYLLKLTSVSST